MKIFNGVVLLISRLLAGINASAGIPSGPLVFGTLAFSGVIAVILNNIKPFAEVPTSIAGVAYLGVAIGLAGLSLGFVLARAVDYVRSF